MTWVTFPTSLTSGLGLEEGHLAGPGGCPGLSLPLYLVKGRSRAFGGKESARLLFFLGGTLAAVSSDRPPGPGKPPVPLVLDDDIRAKLGDVALTARLFHFGVRKGADADTARDVCQQAIMLVLSGERIWDREKQPNVFYRLLGILRDNLKEWRAIGRHETPLAEFEREDEAGSVTNWLLESVADPAGDPEQLAIRSEDEAWEMECYEDMKARLAPHPLTLRILERRSGEDETQAETAAALGVTVKEVEAAYDRILYQAKILREKLRSRR
jgi:DNA-directed RNA polymerase specialized sigma24 family protein